MADKDEVQNENTENVETPEETKDEVQTDTTPKNETKDEQGEEFNPDDYLKSLEPKEDKPDVKALQSQLDLVTKQRDALKDAYLKLKSTGISLVSNPATEQNQKQNPNDIVDEALKKWVHS